MSKYTTELRYICEDFAGLNESVGYKSVRTIIDESWDKVFDFDFPLFDDSYRKVLCTKIIKHYYTREIGEETVGLWQLRLETKMNEIMPYYNKLYKLWARDFDPLKDKDVTRTHTLKRDQTTKTDGITRDLYSDTPQGSLRNVENETYLTNAEKIITGQTGQAGSTDEFVEHVLGKADGKTYSKMLKEYKDALINIDMLIIGDLAPLFMQIW